MDIYELTDKILGGIFGNSFYRGMPEFGKSDEPKEYAVYTVREKPSGYASDIPHARTYWIEVSVFTELAAAALYSCIEIAFTENDFVYQGGTDAGNKNIYPFKNQYAMDFIIDINTNTD